VVSYPLLAAAVGLLDDWLKYRSHSSEGLRSLQKLALQIILTLPWALWVTESSLSLLPGFELPRLAAVPLLLFAGVGFQNAVNVTDGLDGLAAGSALISFAGAFVVGLCLLDGEDAASADRSLLYAGGGRRRSGARFPLA
jgi:phospho-N-acetylmuramoyl-pentapeptide-transferase